MAGANAQTSIAEVRSKPDELFAYAGGLYRRGFHDMALAEYRRFLEANPNDRRAADALYYIAFCLKQLGREKEMLDAIANFRQKYKKDTRCDELGVLATEALQANGSEAQALEILSELCSSKNAVLSEYAKYNLARLFLKNDKPNEAETLLRPLADAAFDAKMPYREYAAMDYAHLLEQRKQLEQALSYTKKVAENKDANGQLAEEACFAAGELCMKLNRKAAAMEAFETCLARFPKGIRAKWCHIYRIRITVEAGKFGKALEMLSEFREKYPDDNISEIDYWQAYALMECKRYNEALSFFQRVASDSKASQEVRMIGQYNSIYCMLHSRNYAEAASQSAAFANAYPRTSLLGDVLLFGSQALLNINRLDEAESQCRKAMALFANTPEKYKNAIELLMSILEKGGKLQLAADELCARAEESAGEAKSGYYLRAARCAQRAGNVVLAQKAYANAASATQDKETKYTSLAYLLQIQLELHKYQAALETLKLLKPICNQDKLPDLLFNEANVLFCEGRNEQAKAVLNEILQAFGSSETRRQKALFMLASILMVEKNDKGAIPILDELLWNKQTGAGAPLTFEFLEAAGQAYARQAQHEKARAAWKRIASLKDCTGEQRNSARLAIARNLLETRNELNEARNILETLRIEGEKGAELDMGEVLSLMAETEMLLEKPEMATSLAERALKMSGTETRSSARALFVLAYISLKKEKNAEKANRFATQCYILADDKEYSPRAMALSIEAFKLLGKTAQAEEVMREISQKYPLWLASHPELRKNANKN